MRSKRLFLIIVILFLCACRENIVHNLSESEANKLMTRLLGQKLDARKDKQADGKWTLTLPESQTSVGIQYLYQNRLLKEEQVAMPEKGGIMQSREEQRFRFERALSREIESTIAGIDGVLQARVHLNMPVVDPLFGQAIENSKGSAGVMLITNQSLIDKAEIVTLVSGASGIPANAISVVLTTSLNKQEEVPKLVVIGKKDFISEFVLKLETFPWALSGMLIGFAMILIGVHRVFSKQQKIAM